MSTLLDQLSDAYRILPLYHDIWGHAHPAPEAAKRALLNAMGVPANDDAEVAQSLQAVARRDWEKLLPTVLVVREDRRPHRITFAIPAEQDGQKLQWCLRRESGAEQRGEILPHTLEESGRAQVDGRDYVRRVWVLNEGVEPGYHRLFLSGPGSSGEMSFIVAPSTCYTSPSLRDDGRIWGYAAQLYGIRSERNWGIGDFGDLRQMIEFSGQVGAGTVLLNPLHALFPESPEHASPYSPSNRAYFNTLYLDVEGIADFAECDAARTLVHQPQFQARLRALRAAEQVEYRGVAEAKAQVLERLYEHFRTQHLAKNTERARAFRAFQAEHGESLRKQALFESLQEYFYKLDNNVWGWPAWPEGYRDQHAPEVEQFCADNLPRVEYFEYLQWQASKQLAAAGTRSWELGLGVGVMLDLAIGVAEGGAATWTRPDLYAFGASTGAPPDEINRLGQDWGLPPMVPHRLIERAYEPFIELLRANMRDSGALRMDHVMGLYRLFWVARGLPVADGAYVMYPVHDLLGILALESQRNRCLVVGEDLGTVPDEVRQVLQDMHVMSTRLLYFERGEHGRLKPPQEYPEGAMAAVTTHDLPTLAGFWKGLDIELRDHMHLFPDDEIRNQQVVGRSEDRAQLLVALNGEGLLPAGGSMQVIDYPEMTPELATAVYTYLARAPSKLLLIQMEDGFGVREQPNLPGTVYPNYPCWHLKIPLNIEEWRTAPYMQGIVAALQQERPVRHVPGPAGIAGGGVKSWIPRATYRLQLNRDFNLWEATELIPYLHALGISHCYLSPLLKARPGSRHGYDITDHSSLNPEIASAEDFEQFVAALKQHDMGMIMDVVPNHMGIMGADNAWWLDVLENGPASRYAGYFDIDWYPLTENLPGRVLLPVLGDHYGAALESGELKLTFDAEQGSFSVFYFEHRFPIDPREYPRILGHGLERLQARLGAEHPVFLEYQTLLTSLGYLPTRDNITPESVAERARDKEVHKHHLAAMYVGSADIAQFLNENIQEFNSGSLGGAHVELMHELLQAQAYRLAFWRVAADEINYRRFFDINDLAALRMDNPEVFEVTHRLVGELLARGYVNGLRIDHPDGLYAPQEYFERLQAMARNMLPPVGGNKDQQKPLYLVVEKILAMHEHLPENWPIHGTTGYDFAAACSGLFVDGAAEEEFTHIYQGFIRAHPDFDEMVRGNKHLIMETSLAGELQVLATQLTRIAKSDRRTCDFTLNSLRVALADIVSCFPVYRTYVSGANTSAEDMRYVDWAVGVAKKRSQGVDASVFDFVREVLLARHGQGKAEEYRQAVCAFAMKFQQYSSPVMAKAVEDTTFYQYNRLASLNEVGGEPQRFGVSLAAFHRENQERARRWPQAMLASSTHDNKRSEDVRARISALSEMPADWQQALARWSKLNRSKRRKLDNLMAPSRNDEYLLYQILLGIWPLSPPDAEAMAQLAARAEVYMLKAAREAKVHSSWINPNAEYEAALRDFVQGLLSPDASNLFLRDFQQLQERVARVGACNSLAQVVLKYMAPGVPDTYQGNELWDFSLVDPDSRRPVDYGARHAALKNVQRLLSEKAGVETLQAQWQDGQIKLYLMQRCLELRRELEALFVHGDYLPLKANGTHAERVCAFMRHYEGESIIVVVPRLCHGLLAESGIRIPAQAWQDTWLELPAERVHLRWRNRLTAQEVQAAPQAEGMGLALAQTLAGLPYAILQMRREA